MASASFPDFSNSAVSEARAAGGGGFFAKCLALGIGCMLAGSDPVFTTLRLWFICKNLSHTSLCCSKSCQTKCVAC